MKKSNWKNKHMHDPEWLLKLGEEFGEVAQAASKHYKTLGTTNPAKRGEKARRKELIEELRHVEFIAQCWREDLERS